MTDLDFISLLEGILGEGLSLIKLQGDASYRIYYRAILPSRKSYIVMKMPAGKASASEEVTNLKEKPTEPPFLSVDRLLKAQGLPVPEILHYDAGHGLIVLEDFGDETFERRILRSTETEKRLWYQKAIDLLILFQQKTLNGPPDSIAHRRSFDATLLNWEFEHFLEYGIEVRLGKNITAEDLAAIHERTTAITRSLTLMPPVLVHRDFQSRNLMIQDEALKLLDFQDALMGPLPYDLVALLRDSYIALPPDLLLELVSYYVSRKNAGGDAIVPAEFQKMFDLMTIQRKLKDAGRFVYIDRVKGNPSFLKHIPNSLSYVRDAFERQTEQRPLFELLKKYVPEFTR